MPDSYPNFRALATERKRSSVHTERLLARALLAALDHIRTVQRAAGVRITSERLAALESEAGRD